MREEAMVVFFKVIILLTFDVCQHPPLESKLSKCVSEKAFNRVPATCGFPHGRTSLHIPMALFGQFAEGEFNWRAWRLQ